MTTGNDAPTDQHVDAAVAVITAAEAPAFVPVPPAVLRARDLRLALQAAGWYVSTLDRAPVHDKATLLHALYQSGEYPAGFGFNWDALLDALRDLAWLGDARGIAFVWRHPDVLETRAQDVAHTFREIVDEAAAHRAAHGYPPLRVIVPAAG